MVQKYLVTGASGYIAMHVIDQLLKEGHTVRGTIRNLKDTDKVDALKKLGPVELVEANLDDAESWKGAVKGMDIVIHIATPTMDSYIMEESEAIKTAVDGALNVLNAAVEEGIKRAVVTSSTIALYDDKTDKNTTFSESNWGDANNVTNEFVRTYHKAKILSEQAVWDFYEKHKKDGFKLATVLPSFTIGPILSSFNRSSVTVFLMGFDKSSGFVPSLMGPLCDVRDVAAAHLKAAQLDEAVGRRLIITNDDIFHSSLEVFKIIEEAGHELNKNIADPEDKDEYKNSRIDNSTMREVLKIEPTDIKKTILDMVQSFFDYNTVEK